MVMHLGFVDLDLGYSFVLMGSQKVAADVAHQPEILLKS